jgi:hypothetical protein
MRSPSRHTLLGSGISLLVAGAILLIADPALAGVRANYVETAAWDTGYQAEYTITNDGPGTITRWRVIFDLPSGSSPSSSWDSVRSGSTQHLIFDNAAWNGELAPGSHTTFGFVVVGLARPVSCTINGGPCDTLAPQAAAPRRTTVRVASFDTFDGTIQVDRGTMPRALTSTDMPLDQLDTVNRTVMNIHIESIESDNDASRAGVVDIATPIKPRRQSRPDVISQRRITRM